MVDFPPAHRPSVKAVHILQLVTATLICCFLRRST